MLRACQCPDSSIHPAPPVKERNLASFSGHWSLRRATLLQEITMTDELKQILCDLIERHGRELVREPKRLEGMLNDACAGQHRGARRVLVDAVRERVVEELL